MTLHPSIVHMLRYWAVHWRRTRDPRFGPSAIARLERLPESTVRNYMAGRRGVRVQ